MILSYGKGKLLAKNRQRTGAFEDGAGNDANALGKLILFDNHFHGFLP